jgi:hypothetical protein
MMCWYGVMVESDQDSLLAFSPQQKVRIPDAQRQIGHIPDTQHIQRVNAGAVMPLNCAPKRAA